MNRSDKPADDLNSLAFLMGGGEMGSLIRSMDWSNTSLGPVAGWPQSLRTTVSICLASNLPICVIWGPGRVQLYNDAYRVICGDKHPRSMGQNFSECWKEAWPVIGKAYDSALAGDTAFLETQQIFLERHGYVEETFFTFSFSPIRDEAGRVGGLFHPVIEMTTQMLGERRTRALRDLAAQTSNAKSVSEALSLSSQTLAHYGLDLPFVLLYALDPDGGQARIVGATGLKADAVTGPSTVDLAAHKQTVWPLEEVVRSGSAVQVDDVRQRIGQAGPYPEAPSAALALPIIAAGADRPTAILIAGLSSRLPMNEAYRGFCDLLASSVTSAVTNARAYEDERRRAKVLAELDQAKTAFFSNVSHEFRTPLTLMLGPIEDALAASDGEQLPPLQRERLEVVYRNGLRLQRLVNSLLDFSRIEAGRARAAFEPTALASFTADLASNFRSACEKAGLALVVDCPPFDEPVFVDRSMWEKIVLNLLSNAFKFTFEGEIAVSIRQADGAAELRVRDTGTGISAEDIARVFERFHRVENARRRTHEGSGIGLALVQELVKLHGGSISAESDVGSGTTFTVRVPLGSQHLPHDQVGSGRSAALPTTGASSFVEEALRWLPDADQRPATGSELPSLQDDPTGSVSHRQRPADDRPLVLVADDNADMRQYIVRLLGAHYRTEAVPDGVAALAAARERRPDLILTDVMMPRLDGFGLLQALRADPGTRSVPVIMLSARAGEESRVEGMQEGADDYLVKPFSARELLARVTAHLQMARMRRESTEAIHASQEQFRALIKASSDVVYRMNADWTELRQLQGREFIANMHEPTRSWMEKYILPDDQPRVLQTIREAIRSKGTFELEHQVMRIDGTLGWAFSRAIPLMDNDGAVVEWFGMASDVTARKQAQEALRASEARFRATFETAAIGIEHTGLDHRWLSVNPAMCSLTGYTAEELLAMTFTELTHPDDLADNLLQRHRLLDGEIASYKIENRLIHRSGRIVWVTASAALLRDAAGRPQYFVGALEDITQQKDTLVQLDMQRRFVERLAHGMPSTLHVFDRAENQNVWVNRHLGDTLGYAAADIERMGADFLRQVLHSGDVAALQRHFELAFGSADDDVQEIEYRVRDRAGHWRWLHQSDTVFRRAPDGLAVELVGTATDVTGRKRIEADLLYALAAAEDANKAKSEFLSHMSHELRSPLNAVLGFAQLLQSGKPPPTAPQEECVTEILQAGWYLLGLIDEILDLSLIESGRLSCVLKTVPLAAVLDECHALVEGQAAARGIRLNFPQLDDRCAVVADRTRLKQVVVNILSNAIKYNRDGGTVQVSCGVTKPGSISIRIEDSGSGLSPEQLGRIFQPFDRLGQEGGMVEGTGIGLALSKRLVELMGGRIGVHSVVGQGSEFWVDMDAPDIPPSIPADAPLGTPETTPAASGRRLCTVLCVEDNRANQLLVQRLLARLADVRLVLAGDGLQGLQLARELQPDVVLMDINLPGLSGLKAMERLAADAATAHIPVIAVSALAMQHDIDKGLQAGFFRYLSKPIKIDALTEALDAALGLADRPDEAPARAVVAQPARTASAAKNSKKVHTP